MATPTLGQMYSEELRKENPGTPAPKTSRRRESQGFGEIFNDAEANRLAAERAGAMNTENSLALMALGRPRDVPYGGKKSWAEAANEGLKQGLGMYEMLNNLETKKKAMAQMLRSYDEKYNPQPMADMTGFRQDPYAQVPETTPLQG